MKSTISIASVLALLGACGNVTSSLTSNSTLDTDTMAEMAAGSMDDAIESAADDAGYSSTTFLGGEITPLTADYSRTCTVDGSGAVTVDANLSVNESVTVTRSRGVGVTTVTDSGTLSRVWTPPSGITLACSSKNRVYLDWTADASVNGLAVAISFNRTRNITNVFTPTSGLARTRSLTYVASGTRAVTWAVGSTSGDAVTRVKTITSTAARTRTYTSAAGVSTDLATTVSTKSGDPLVIEVTRSVSAGTLSTKKIASGTLVVTKSGSGKVELTYDDVLFSFAASDPCMPISGTISGSYYAEDSDTASKTFTVTFGADTDSTSSITFEGSTSEDFAELTVSGCDLKKEST